MICKFMGGWTLDTVRALDPDDYALIVEEMQKAMPEDTK